jgi:hypothetical protein
MSHGIERATPRNDADNPSPDAASDHGTGTLPRYSASNAIKGDSDNPDIPALVRYIFRDERNRRCTRFVAVCNSATGDDDAMAERIAACLNADIAKPPAAAAASGEEGVREIVERWKVKNCDAGSIAMGGTNRLVATLTEHLRQAVAAERTHWSAIVDGMNKHEAEAVAVARSEALKQAAQLVRDNYFIKGPSVAPHSLAAMITKLAPRPALSSQTGTECGDC